MITVVDTKNERSIQKIHRLMKALEIREIDDEALWDRARLEFNLPEFDGLWTIMSEEAICEWVAKEYPDLSLEDNIYVSYDPEKDEWYVLVNGEPLPDTDDLGKSFRDALNAMMRNIQEQER